MGINQKTISLTDRFITAIISAFTAAVTIVIYFIGSIVIAPRGGQIYAIPMMYSFFSKIGIYAIILASIAGFFLGPEKMSNIFSFFWGTHQTMKKECPKIVGVLLFLIIFGVLVYAIYFIWRYSVFFV